MNKDIQKIQKELIAAKDNMLKVETTNAISNIDVAKYIKNGKLNVSNLVSNIRNHISNVVREVDKKTKIK